MTDNKLTLEVNDLWRKRWNTISVLAVFLTIIKMASRTPSDLLSFTAETLLALVISFAVSFFFHWAFMAVYNKLTERNL